MASEISYPRLPPSHRVLPPIDRYQIHQIITARWQGVNNLPTAVTQPRHDDCESNSRPVDRNYHAHAAAQLRHHGECRNVSFIAWFRLLAHYNKQ